MRLKVLDLFCGAGGAAVGYYNAFTAAGFDVDISGVDINPQKHYPFTMRVDDAMTWPLEGYDFIHASPPCQDHSIATNAAKGRGKVYDTGWMLEATYKRFQSLSIPWIIENVATAKMHQPIILCGSMFGLRVLRHRKFDSNIFIFAPSCNHVGTTIDGTYLTVAGHSYQKYQPKNTFSDRCKAMGIDWMNRLELPQAIHPVNAQFLGANIAQAMKG
ncbi:MAG: DNA cytosine methyltransferase [Patescibacteria group bacterium]|nr:DNA cytosine methyltransferase [Patescibacteria group bacterium]